jgi:rSAM/selenodomain-associated transferase 1
LSDPDVIALVVAKAPVPGLAKTRLAATVGDQAAADIAAAALLDTLDAVAATPVAARVVAMTGDLDRASRADEIRQRLAGFTVIEQRGDGFAERLVAAHADAAAAAGERPVLQIGMDTPQVTPELLSLCVQTLLDAPAVLGLARDGGWWVLGVRSAVTAQCLRDVPMSTSETGALTLAALQRTGIHPQLLPELHDVDTVEDVDAVRAACPPGSRFVRCTRTAGV